MPKKHFSILTITKNILYGLLALWLIMAAPTSWLYDLWSGTGNEQGQKPNGSVQKLQNTEDIETFFSAKTPATVTGTNLIPCPLARLRDISVSGTHYYRKRGVRRKVSVSEYVAWSYPVPFWQNMCQMMIGGHYNRYHLLQLEDGSYLCVYFDDYLALTGASRYPAGYVRAATWEEQNMLNQMAGDYDVTPYYVLDMYRYEKVNWMIDLSLRIVMLFVVTLLLLYVMDWLKKLRKSSSLEHKD